MPNRSIEVRRSLMPTISKWGLAVMVALLLGAGAFVMKRWVAA